MPDARTWRVTAMKKVRACSGQVRSASPLSVMSERAIWSTS